MDLWSRLVAGANASAGKKQANPRSPQERLTNFKRAYLQLQQIWQKTGLRRPDASTAQAALFHLQTVNRILQAETHTAAPYPCMRDVSTSQVYVLVTSIGSAGPNEEITKEAVRFLGLLIDSEEVDFIEDCAFADRLVSFMRTATGTESMVPDTKSEIAELLFAIAAKLRQRPSIPKAWFRPSDDASRRPISRTSVRVTKSQEFPLVYMLLEYVHHDGKTGDFARTGLLYLLEIAGRAEGVERWVVESELATMMASSVGALYSQLSSKVSLEYPKDKIPPILAFSDVIGRDHPSDAESIHSTALQANLATFISSLVFWQDVLERCPSHDIKATLLDHFDFLFLRPLLYPSLVESSDKDSGSSIAVMTYFTNILESLSNTDMIRLMLHYMLGAPTQSSQGSKPSRPSTLARRRKSETLISNSALRVNDPSPDLITLTNILHGYLRSSNQQTVTASLRLLAVISRSWHQFANTALMKVQTAGRASERRSKSTYDQELEVLYSLAEEILDDDALEFSYESHLQDAQTMLESHPCAAQQLLPLNIKDLEKMTLRRPPRQRTIAPEDPLLATLLSLLENFLVNNIMVNLSLTEAFAALASCGETRLEGWLLASEFETTVHIGANNHNNSDDTLFSSNKRHVTSPVFARLESLVERIGRLKQEVQDYDIYLAERRHIFRVGGEIDDALADVPPRVSHESQDRKRADQKPLANASTISERVAVSSDVSRSISPRGRQRDHSTNHHPPPKSLVGRLSHLRISPSPSRSNPLERIHSASPLRKQSTSSMTSSPIPSPKGPPDALRQKVRLKVAPTQRRHARENGGSETSSLYSEASSLRCDDLEDFREVSLSHLLTNVIILQEFILELAAIVQVRASLFDELSLC